MAGHQGKCLFRIDLPGDPPPHGLDRLTIIQRFTVTGIELLAVENGHGHITGAGESLRLRDAVQGVPFACGVE